MVENTRPAWRSLGSVAPRALGEARLVLHHAAQVVTGAGRSLLPARSDDSQTAFTWEGAHEALVGEALPGASRVRFGLRPAELSLLALVPGPEGSQPFFLAGRTLADAQEWMRREAASRGLEAAHLEWSVPYEIPPHPVAGGEPFAADTASLTELARWFCNGDGLLREFLAGVREASPVRCWPHHFDIGALLQLAEGGHAETTPTIGVGLSPGDTSYAEPYFYVTAWPRPERGIVLPPLPTGGAWHEEGWLGAILTGTALLETSGPTPAAQAARVRGFLDSAMAAARSLLA